MAKHFHEYFGFSRKGINAQVLVSPELDKVDDKQHWFSRKRHHAFLRAVHYGCSLPLDSRLLLNMNPSQILGAMAGFSIIAYDRAIEKWKTDPVELYCNLYKRGLDAYKPQLDQIDGVSLEKHVRPFPQTDRSLFERLGVVVCRHPDISAKFQMSSGLKYLFDTGLDETFDPGAGRPNVTNRRKYAKNILSRLNSAYAAFRNSEGFEHETVMAQNAMIVQ
ncbi:Uncharacterised protein [uncultured archaeon]|nr:Uncharacterised protein [uncultured archaeon]